MIKVLLIILGGILVIDQATFERQIDSKFITVDPIAIAAIEEMKIEQEMMLLKAEREIDCLTRNIYFEARDQSIEGQYAVAEVVLNRIKDPEFPSSICEVVEQKNEKVCQFSWFCDGKSDKMRDRKAILIARNVALSSIANKTNFTDGALYYHANYVSPDWQNVKMTTEIEDHIFYSSI
jgi:spore germination cell wall hydrolase CwlJ-like protein